MADLLLLLLLQASPWFHWWPDAQIQQASSFAKAAADVLLYHPASGQVQYVFVSADPIQWYDSRTQQFVDYCVVPFQWPAGATSVVQLDLTTFLLYDRRSGAVFRQERPVNDVCWAATRGGDTPRPRKDP